MSNDKKKIEIPLVEDFVPDEKLMKEKSELLQSDTAYLIMELIKISQNYIINDGLDPELATQGAYVLLSYAWHGTLSLTEEEIIETCEIMLHRVHEYMNGIIKDHLTITKKKDDEEDKPDIKIVTH